MHTAWLDPFFDKLVPIIWSHSYSSVSQFPYLLTETIIMPILQGLLWKNKCLTYNDYCYHYYGHEDIFTGVTLFLATIKIYSLRTPLEQWNNVASQRFYKRLCMCSDMTAFPRQLLLNPASVWLPLWAHKDCSLEGLFAFTVLVCLTS